jgi:hypothetical protein
MLVMVWRVFRRRDFRAFMILAGYLQFSGALDHHFPARFRLSLLPCMLFSGRRPELCFCPH